MDRLSAKDFYDWHPLVGMTSAGINTLDTVKVVRLTAKLDFLNSVMSYVVTVRGDDETHSFEYDCLGDAIECFNEESEECKSIKL